MMVFAERFEIYESENICSAGSWKRICSIDNYATCYEKLLSLETLGLDLNKAIVIRFKYEFDSSAFGTTRLDEEHTVWNAKDFIKL